MMDDVPTLLNKVSQLFGQTIGMRWYGTDIFIDRGTTTIEAILYNQVIAT